MFKIDNRLLYKVDDIILNENNFILFSREETKTSTLYNTLKSISKSDLIIRYNLGTKNLKKDYINDLIEKSIEKEIITYVKEDIIKDEKVKETKEKEEIEKSSNKDDKVDKEMDF